MNFTADRVWVTLAGIFGLPRYKRGIELPGVVNIFVQPEVLVCTPAFALICEVNCWYPRQ